jgi:broad specificity phosphatase PhoE
MSQPDRRLGAQPCGPGGRRCRRGSREGRTLRWRLLRVSLPERRSVRIFLVRHSEPQVSPLVDPREWSLSESGRSAAERLRGRLPAVGVWVASTEAKAYETLLCARCDGYPSIAQDARLDEVRRVEPFGDDFRARRRAWVEGRLDERHMGWETPLDAATRFDAVVRGHSALESALVIGSHGMVLTSWLVHARGAVDQQAAGTFWEEMTFPHVIEVRQN